MKELKYKVIRSKKQYYQYCNILEELVCTTKKSKGLQDEIELLTVLIEDWDDKHMVLPEFNPVELLQYLMRENSISQTDLIKILGVSKGLVSEILNYKKGMSKEIIRKLAEHFKLRQEAFNREYALKKENVVV